MAQTSSALRPTTHRDLVSRVRILNGDFDPLTLSEVVDWAAAHIREGRKGCLCTVNVAILMMMREDARLQQIVDRASLVVADGRPLVWVSRLGNDRLPERVAGVDLIGALAGRAAREGFGMYLLGARRPVVESAARRLLAEHPDLSIRGIADGYFGAADAVERARAIRRSGAQILLVGMGVPRQEFFLEEQWAELDVNLAIGVGGSFEVLAGIRRRAPHWCQQAGLEWFWRLMQEPRRLGPRYVETNSKFICHVVREIIAKRNQRVPA
jgi:N-acetylglucosaminyldiphosphoundecaprenol N-acetyl-beta-D-mannosaminyltransferase